MIGALLALALAAAPAATAGTSEPTVSVPAFQLPYTSYGSEEGRRVLRDILDTRTPDFGGDVAAARAFYQPFNDARWAEARRRHPVDVRSETMGGVRVDVVTPKGGVRPENRGRVLINMHGGAFMWGAGSGALVEAGPVAAVAGMTVVTVDYRLAPENRFPAASQDLAAVYRALLKTHRPEQIGVYGCSAGGILTAEAIPWFAHEGLPRPGAIGALCGSGLPPEGDSAFVTGPLMGQPAPAPGASLISAFPYFAGVAVGDPLAWPGVSPAMLATFPPTLLIAGGRDFMASSQTTMQRRLAAAGVPVEGYLFDGMPHAFLVWAELPEAQEAYRLIARFFDRHLAH